MEEHPNVEAVRQSLEAFSKGDMETMAGGIADDAVWHIPGTHRFAGDFTGKAAILARFGEMAKAGAGTTIEEIHDIVGNDDHVAALMRLTVAGPNGTSSQNAVWIMHVRDGHATEFWAHNQDQGAIDGVLG